MREAPEASYDDEGNVIVELEEDDLKPSSFGVLEFHLSPEQARALSGDLFAAARAAEEKQR